MLVGLGRLAAFRGRLSGVTEGVCGMGASGLHHAGPRTVVRLPTQTHIRHTQQCHLGRALSLLAK